MKERQRRADFDHIARPYRWLEYASFGRALERCREYFLTAFGDKRCALVLGDGDGRFLRCLLSLNATIQVDAVDTSAAMLKLLRNRCGSIAGASGRLKTHHVSALDYAKLLRAQPPCYDLVVTHFLLDCLEQEQVEELVTLLRPHLMPGAVWLVSEFSLPAGWLHLPSRWIVRALYLVFKLITGLRTDHLPDYATALARAGLARTARHVSLGGLLITELWSAPRADASGHEAHALQYE